MVSPREAAVRCPTEAVAWPVTSASRGPARRSPGRCSRPPRAARRVVLVPSSNEPSDFDGSRSRRESGDVSVAWANCSQFIDTVAGGATSVDVQSVSGCRRRRGCTSAASLAKVRVAVPAPSALRRGNSWPDGWATAWPRGRSRRIAGWKSSLSARDLLDPRQVLGPRRRRARGNREWPSAASAEPAVE